MSTNIEQLIGDSAQKISAAQNQNELEKLRIEILGKKGLVGQLMSKLKEIPKEETAEYGKKINDFKNEVNLLLQNKKEELKKADLLLKMEAEWIDVTLPKNLPKLGSLHPITLVQNDLEDLFSQMGFLILDGPHIDTEYYNFTALNIPDHHPARDMQDTFYFENGMLLRTQTSTIQIRGMEILAKNIEKEPIRIIGPGKVFRAERIDASHECVFHQLEGMVIDKDISVANLNYFMKVVIEKIFERETKFRLRPGYFPFVEPGFELDLQCQICAGEGCKTCKHVGWIELLGCGMVHPNVLRNGGIDPQKYSGFAFGMGIDRLAMNKYGIDDIRNIHNGHIEFSRQFSKVS